MVLFARGPQAVKIIVPSERQRWCETASSTESIGDAAIEDEMVEGNGGGKRFPGFEWLRMSPIKGRLFCLYSARAGMDETKGLILSSSLREGERCCAAASAPSV